MRFKKIIAAALAVITAAGVMAGCSSSDAESANTTAEKKITLAYQYGIAYAPVMVMEQQKLLEKYLPDYTIEYQVISSGSAITDAVAAGTLDVAYVGYGPAITGAASSLWKIYSAIGGAPNGLITKDTSINSLKDFTSGQQIALVNIGSAQHIVLAMACEQVLGDARALDGNITAMAHPDGLQALLNDQVTAQVTATPYLEQGLADSDVHEIEEVRNAFPKGCPFIVGTTTQAFHDNTEAYEALIKATNEAMEYVNNNHEEVAELLSESTEIEKDDLVSYLAQDDVFFQSNATGILEVAQFMKRAEFIETEITSLSDLAYDNVTE